MFRSTTMCLGKGSTYEIRRGKKPGKIISYVDAYYELTMTHE